MWNKPWKHNEGFAICIGLFIIGNLLQSILGKIQLSQFVWPLNLFAGILFLLFLVTCNLLSSRIYLLRWMTTVHASISAFISLTMLTVIMGLTRQYDASVEIPFSHGFGFSQMLSSYAFSLLFLWFTTLLGLTTIKRLTHARLRDIPFISNHLGLFIALTCGVLGDADMQRLRMVTTIGRPEWRATNEKQEILELPIAIELTDFTIEEYPPKLLLINNETGNAIPTRQPQTLLLDDSFESGELFGWEITLLENIPLAARMETEDTLRYVEFHSLGGAHAIYVKAKNKRTQEEHTHWLSCGSFLFPYKAIRLDEQVSLIMGEPEPKKFASQVTAYTEAGEMLKAIIEVNKPLALEGWKIYQLSYDESKGKWSDTSIFELVKDPWLPAVYSGIFLMLLGAVFLFILSPKSEGPTS